MDRKAILSNYWRLTTESEGWYPPYVDALKDVNVALASWRPEGEAANTIWETINHITYFKERLLRRLQGLPDRAIADNDETFIVRGQSEAEWQESLDKLFGVHRELGQVLEGLGEEDLDRPLPKEPIVTQFLNLIVHDAYHTGQIILIRKLKGAWPERRSFL